MKKRRILEILEKELSGDKDFCVELEFDKKHGLCKVEISDDC